MSGWERLSTGVEAWRAPAVGTRKGALVLIQEIFGVNANIRALADRFAAEGFEVLAPSYYDRVRPRFEAGYDEAGVADGRAATAATTWDTVAADTDAAIAVLGGEAHVAGFCWGEAAAWVAAARCSGVTGAAGFYGRLIVTLLGEAPKAPIILHYGAHDPIIPPEGIAAVRAAHPDVPVHVYPAGHGFFSDRGHDHDPAQADLAWARTLDFWDLPA